MRPTNNDHLAASMQVINFIILDMQISLELNYVKKVISLPMIKTLPKSPDYLIGLINIEGESIPALDLALCLGFSREVPYSLDMPILLCSKDGKTFAIIVDKILGLETINQGALQLKESFDEKNSFFKASVLINQKTSLLIDLDKIFSAKLISEYNIQ